MLMHPMSYPVNRCTQRKSWSRKSHDASDFTSHCWSIAMDFTLSACGFVFTVSTAVKSLMAVAKELCAIVTESIRG